MATALASPVADADPFYAAYGYVPALYNSYPNWPGVSTPYSSSTCFGCRGKRSADADADADASALYGYYGYAPYAYAPYAYAGYGYAPYGYGHATSFEARSPQGLRGKRSADAEPEADAYYSAYGYGYPYAYGYGYPSAYAYGYGYPRAYGYGYARW